MADDQTKRAVRGPKRSDSSAARSVAMNEAAVNPAVAIEAAAFLREQIALTRLQVDHFEAEHRHTIDGNRATRALEAMKIILQGALTLVVIGAAILFVNMIWNASRD